MNPRNLIIVFIAVFGLALSAGCGKKTTASGTLRMNFTAASAGTGASLNSVALSLREQAEEQILNATASSVPTYTNADFTVQSITSGAPDTLNFTIKKIALGNDTTEISIFENAAGKALDITGSRIDISDMFTQADCLDNTGKAYTLKTGETCDCGFDTANNPISKQSWTRTNKDGTKTTVDGCPWENPTPDSANRKRGAGGKFATVVAQVGAFTKMTVTFGRKAKIKGCVTGNYSASTITGSHTYCTQAAKSMYQSSGGGTAADFEDKTAEEMDFDLLQIGSSSAGGSDDLAVDFPVKNSVTIAEGQETPLTLVIDTNRLLRFYNLGRTDQGPNPGSPTTKAYFFSSVFEKSVFAFAGQAGGIQGYQWIAHGCLNIETANIPTNYICTSTSGADSGTVGGWLTIITDPDGVPMGTNFMPDDDNALVLLKGGNQGVTSAGRMEFIEGSVTKISTGVYDLTFGLDVSSGTLKSLDTTMTVGTSVDGVKFRGMQKSYGLATVTRKL